jgi:hypothetical protein
MSFQVGSDAAEVVKQRKSRRDVLGHAEKWEDAPVLSPKSPPRVATAAPHAQSPRRLGGESSLL